MPQYREAASSTAATRARRAPRARLSTIVRRATSTPTSSRAGLARAARRDRRGGLGHSTSTRRRAWCASRRRRRTRSQRASSSERRRPRAAACDCRAPPRDGRPRCVSSRPRSRAQPAARGLAGLRLFAHGQGPARPTCGSSPSPAASSTWAPCTRPRVRFRARPSRPCCAVRSCATASSCPTGRGAGRRGAIGAARASRRRTSSASETPPASTRSRTPRSIAVGPSGRSPHRGAHHRGGPRVRRLRVPPLRGRPPPRHREPRARLDPAASPHDVYHTPRAFGLWLSLIMFDERMQRLYAARVSGSEVLADRKRELLRPTGLATSPAARAGARPRHGLRVDAKSRSRPTLESPHIGRSSARSNGGRRPRMAPLRPARTGMSRGRQTGPRRRTVQAHKRIDAMHSRKQRPPPSVSIGTITRRVRAIPLERKGTRLRRQPAARTEAATSSCNGSEYVSQTWPGSPALSRNPGVYGNDFRLGLPALRGGRLGRGGIGRAAGAGVDALLQLLADLEEGQALGLRRRRALPARGLQALVGAVLTDLEAAEAAGSRCALCRAVEGRLHRVEDDVDPAALPGPWASSAFHTKRR